MASLNNSCCYQPQALIVDFNTNNHVIVIVTANKDYNTVVIIEHAYRYKKDCQLSNMFNDITYP